MIKTVSVQELCEQLDTDSQTVLIDLRPAHEFEQGHVAQARNIPLGTMSVREIMAEWGREAEGKPIYFICQSGGRSQQVLDELEDVGFHWAQSVAGGMVAWCALGLPIEADPSIYPEMARPGRSSHVTMAVLILVGCAMALFVNKSFLLVPILVAAEMLFRGLTGWAGVSGFFERKRAGD